MRKVRKTKRWKIQLHGVSCGVIIRWTQKISLPIGRLWRKYEAGEMSLEEVVSLFLGMSEHWGLDLNEIPELTTNILNMTSNILTNGMKKAITDMVVGA